MSEFQVSLLIDRVYLLLFYVILLVILIKRFFQCYNHAAAFTLFFVFIIAMKYYGGS